MSIAGIRGGQAFVEFLIKDDQLDSGLNKVSQKLTNFGRDVGKAIAPMAGLFSAAVGVSAKTGGELEDMSRRTGVSVEQLSMLSYAAEQSGVDVGTLEKAFKGLEKNGIDPEMFTQIAADIASIPDHTKRVQRALDIFGKAGYDIVPLLEDLPELNAHFQALGLTMTTRDAKAADDLGDSWVDVRKEVTKLAEVVGAALAGPLTEFLQWSVDSLKTVIAWVQENPLLVQTLAAVTGAIFAASAATFLLGTAFSFIAAHPIIFAMSATGAVLAVVSKSFTAAAVGALLFGGALALLQKNKWVALLTIVAALAVWIASWFGYAADSVADFNKQLARIPGLKSLQGGGANQPQPGPPRFTGPSAGRHGAAANATERERSANVHRGAGDAGDGGRRFTDIERGGRHHDRIPEVDRGKQPNHRGRGAAPKRGRIRRRVMTNRTYIARLNLALSENRERWRNVFAAWDDEQFIELGGSLSSDLDFAPPLAPSADGPLPQCVLNLLAAHTVFLELQRRAEVEELEREFVDG